MVNRKLTLDLSRAFWCVSREREIEMPSRADAKSMEIGTCECCATPQVFFYLSWPCMERRCATCTSSSVATLRNCSKCGGGADVHKSWFAPHLSSALIDSVCASSQSSPLRQTAQDTLRCLQTSPDGQSQMTLQAMRACAKEEVRQREAVSKEVTPKQSSRRVLKF